MRRLSSFTFSCELVETGSLKKTQEGSESSRHDDFVGVIDEVHDHLIVESQEGQDSRISEEIVSPSNHDTQQDAKNDNVDFSMIPIKVDIIENTEEVGECTSEVRGQSYEEVKAKYFEVFEVCLPSINRLSRELNPILSHIDNLSNKWLYAHENKERRHWRLAE